MHTNIYRVRDDIHAVCHVHGHYIVAATTLLESGESAFPPVTPGVVYFSWPLPMLPFQVPGTRELAQSVEEQFANHRISAVLLKNHGVIAAGKTLLDTVNIIEEIDEAAAIYVLTQGKCSVIPGNDIPRIC